MSCTLNIYVLNGFLMMSLVDFRDVLSVVLACSCDGDKEAQSNDLLGYSVG